jgi:thiamine biosynthesis lipoprotein
MPSRTAADWQLRRAESYWRITYTAMASPCELLVCSNAASEAEELASLAHRETARIEAKFSRYRDDSIVQAINHSGGASVAVDEETRRLLRYAAQCYELSGGLFDITSGVLRRAWTFDGGEVTPDRDLIRSLQARVGWDRVELDERRIRLMPGMEIDLGGIGKEYAADRVAELVKEASGTGVMVNLGGDIRVIGGPGVQGPWSIGIEDPRREDGAVGQVELVDGGVATSGDARRFCTVLGMRLGHILDPRSGWPIVGAPRSATVVAASCTEAGFLATMAMLQGPGAESFLAAQDVTYHCIR